MGKKTGMNKTYRFALINFGLNTAYSIHHIIFGIATRSLWLFNIGVYYVILSVMRIVVLKSKSPGYSIRFTGTMLMLLSLPLAGTVILSFVKDRGKEFHLIVMLATAVYSFTKITLATVKFIKSRKSASVKLKALRNISFADAFVSIFSLQRSMLVSFEGMSETGIRIMNASTGSAVYIIVFLLGLNLILYINKQR